MSAIGDPLSTNNLEILKGLQANYQMQLDKIVFHLKPRDKLEKAKNFATENLSSEPKLTLERTLAMTLHAPIGGLGSSLSANALLYMAEKINTKIGKPKDFAYYHKRLTKNIISYGEESEYYSRDRNNHGYTIYDLRELDKMLAYFDIVIRLQGANCGRTNFLTCLSKYLVFLENGDVIFQNGVIVKSGIESKERKVFQKGCEILTSMNVRYNSKRIHKFIQLIAKNALQIMERYTPPSAVLHHPIDSSKIIEDYGHSSAIWSTSHSR